MTRIQTHQAAVYHSQVNPMPPVPGASGPNPIAPPTTGAPKWYRPAPSVFANQHPNPPGQSSSRPWPHLSNQNQNALNAQAAPPPWTAPQTQLPQTKPPCGMLPQGVFVWGGSAFTRRKHPPIVARGTVRTVPSGAGGGNPAYMVL